MKFSKNFIYLGTLVYSFTLLGETTEPKTTPVFEGIPLHSNQLVLKDQNGVYRIRDLYRDQLLIEKNGQLRLFERAKAEDPNLYGLDSVKLIEISAEDLIERQDKELKSKEEAREKNKIFYAKKRNEDLQRRKSQLEEELKSLQSNNDTSQDQKEVVITGIPVIDEVLNNGNQEA